MKKIKYFSINFPIAILFLSLNSIIFFLSYFTTLNVYLEVLKILQLFFLVFLITFSSLNKYIKTLLISIIYLVYLVLIFFNLTTRTYLDFFFLKRNIANISPLLSSFGLTFTIVVCVSLLNSFLINQLTEKIKIKKIFFIALIALVVGCFFINEKYSNPIFVFAKSIYSSDENIDNYQKNVYTKLINESINNKSEIIRQATEIDKKNLPSNLDNIVFIQIESLNSFLINEKNTPNYLEISKEGLYFPKFYGNSVQTILGQENILCSLPSSFDLNLVKSGLDKEVLCLPEVFQNLGYKTMFFKTFDLDFDKTGDFMKNIGFDEVHANSIMEEDDPKYMWGNREDVFYERAFNYLAKNTSENNFIYLEIGPTNHWPFSTPKDFTGKTPFENPKNHQERLTNTIFIQDFYLKIAWEKLNKLFPEKNYTAIILGDHSWPAEIHENNFFNQRYAFKENFSTSMIIIFGNNQNYPPKIIAHEYSQMDIMPTLLDLYGIKKESEFNQSLRNITLGENLDNPQKPILLIQPYGDRYITTVQDNKIEQYNSSKKTNSILNEW